MSQPDWPARVACVIAGEVRRLRDARKMSARQLAERCAELGLEIPQAVLANLENGRRPLVSVAELLVLAAALDVPPVLLVAPLGRQPSTEILPGREMPTWDAVLWQSGDARLLPDSSGDQTEWLSPDDDEAIVPLFHEHERLVARWQEFEPVDGDPFEPDVVDIREQFAAALRQLRVLMRQRGLLLPQLPPALQFVDSERPRHRRR